MQKFDFRKDILPLKDKLFRLAYRITFNRQEAEDIVQDTMLRVWSKRGELGEVESVEAYCTVVAKNLAIDRSQKKETQNLWLDPETKAMPVATDPYDRLVKDERMKIIHELIDKLPEKQRIIIRLRDIEEKSYKEIAEALNVTEEQVKVNLYRARQKIRAGYTEIEEYGL